MTTGAGIVLLAGSGWGLGAVATGALLAGTGVWLGRVTVGVGVVLLAGATTVFGGAAAAAAGAEEVGSTVATIEVTIAGEELERTAVGLDEDTTDDCAAAITGALSTEVAPF